MMYRVFDFLIESNIALPELPEIKKGTSSVSFHLSPNSPPINEEPVWSHHWRLPGGEITISCARKGNDYYLRFPRLADFLISEKGDEIHCRHWPDVPNDTVRHLLLDQVIPRVVGHQGRIVLHASANRLGTGCIVFLGETGWGKSTLATSFHQNGYPLLTDDSLLLQVAGKDSIGIPSYAGSRLWSDSFEAIMGELSEFKQMAHYSSKKRLIFHSASEAPEPNALVLAVFILDSPEQLASTENIDISPITGAQGVVELVKNSFYLDITDRKKIGEQFKELGSVVTMGLPVYRLSYPRNHSFLPAVRNAVKQIAEKNRQLH